ncbi:MAG: hypothetical protein LKJ64_03830 [Lentilactobacillus buchneri]|nr:hypothetical protein [Lentilactobacillus buchneri]MCI2019710.1 hypothetical protein [Lentilactobacillus buchneri]MCI2028114.1 hypothetical protein [Lentilactobacillus buchneri]
MSTRKISDLNELKQAMLSDLESIVNSALLASGLNYGYAYYPWELIDRLQISLENLPENSVKYQQISHLVNLTRTWYDAIIELGNVANVPGEKDHNWFT